ncbi:MAG: rhodanese-like domain-containing protein [Acidobacteria bacterium]|nr:rhodanese-like domain-containing protein [Acidobacteriota bacterium]
MMPTEITPADVKAMLQRGDDFLLIDVRETFEHKVRNIPQAMLIPMNDVPRRLSEIDPARRIVVHCKAGGRSARVCDFLRQNGYKNVLNMSGGIDCW